MSQQGESVQTTILSEHKMFRPL